MKSMKGLKKKGISEKLNVKSFGVPFGVMLGGNEEEINHRGHRE